MDDRQQIYELYVKYALAIDGRQYEEWIGYFTEDGVFDSSRMGRYAGRDELRKFVEKYEQSLEGGQIRHVISNILVDITGNTAKGRCYLNLYLTKNGKTEMIGVGTYDDRLRKVGEKWLFESRKVVLDR